LPFWDVFVSALRHRILPAYSARSASRGGGAISALRWIHLHMIGEYARHKRHADLIRERVDGAVGE
jgi:hypothetical protein